MKLPPAIIIHGLEDAKLALAPGLPVTLLSAPAAALFGGCLWWAALLQHAGVEGVSLFDCGNAPGRALEALRLGLPGIVLNCEMPAYGVVAGIAAAQRALLLPCAPAALNLAVRGAECRIRLWLHQADDSG